MQRGGQMIEKLRINAIYKDFIKEIHLTDEQIRILDMYINKETIVKIALEIGMSQRSVSYEIKKIKRLYNDYVFLQTWKTILLN